MSLIWHLCFVNLVFCMVHYVSAVCNGNKDCLSCTSAFSSSNRCKWCPTTSSCEEGNSNCTNSLGDPLSCLSDEDDGNFNPERGYVATLLAAVAYTDDPKTCLDKMFSDKIELKEVVGKKCEKNNLFYFDYKECLAYTALWHSQKRIIVSYRGTTSGQQLVDEVLSALKDPQTTSKVGGNIQEYFRNANDQLYSCVSASVRDMLKTYPDYSLVIVGHSLGGAVASIASAYLSGDSVIKDTKTTLYTFGMPRPGDKEFAIKHDELIPRSWRIVNNRDLVNRVPPRSSESSGPFHHSREIFYNSGMNIDSQYKECADLEDSSCSIGILLPWSIANHRTYYNIPVGSHCDNIVKRRRKRADEPSEMNTLFEDSKCKRIKFCDNQICGVRGYHEHGLFKLLFVAILLHGIV